jgi:hypothetical protein
MPKASEAILNVVNSKLRVNFEYIFEWDMRPVYGVVGTRRSLQTGMIIKARSPRFFNATDY